jgi:hypothetical protein
MCDISLVQDDFYDNTCPVISTTYRFAIIASLFTISVVISIICVVKLIHTACVWHNLNSRRLLFSVLLTTVHYTCVLIMCVLLYSYRMNDYLGTVITGSFALSIGCVEQCFHLIEILFIYSKSTLMRNNEYMIRLQRTIVGVSILCGFNWFIWSCISFSYGNHYTYLCFMWGGLALATVIWAGCFYIYGSRALNEIRSHVINTTSTTVGTNNDTAVDSLTKAVKKQAFGTSSPISKSHLIQSGIYVKLQLIIYLYTIMSFSISIMSVMVITLPLLYERTFYVYGVMGSVLGIVDMLYIIVISLTHNNSVNNAMASTPTGMSTGIRMIGDGIPPNRQILPVKHAENDMPLPSVPEGLGHQKQQRLFRRVDIVHQITDISVDTELNTKNRIIPQLPILQPISPMKLGEEQKLNLQPLSFGENITSPSHSAVGAANMIFSRNVMNGLNQVGDGSGSTSLKRISPYESTIESQKNVTIPQQHTATTMAITVNDETNVKKTLSLPVRQPGTTTTLTTTTMTATTIITNDTPLVLNDA